MNRCTYAHLFLITFLIACALPVHAKKYSHVNNSPRVKKPYTIAIYVSGRNDLEGFLIRQIKSLMQIGSNDQVNFCVHADLRLQGKRVTRRYFVEHGKLIHINQDEQSTQAMDSADPATLVSFMRLIDEKYPAENIVLVIANHGSGILDPIGQHNALDARTLFTFNPETQKYDLDRSVGYFDLLALMDKDPRGCCWDDLSGRYLTNQKLIQAFDAILKIMNGRKLAMVVYDACMMSMIEFAQIMAPYARIQVSSQDVEYGPGIDYTRSFAVFKHGVPTPEELARHMVDSYKTTYQSMTNDFTMSALYLERIEELEIAVDELADLLVQALRMQKSTSVKNALVKARAKEHCTHFHEHSYLDLDHLCTNIRTALAKMEFADIHRGRALSDQLHRQTLLVQELISHAVFANVAGSHLSRARGISIYCPAPGRKLHPSYTKIPFAQNGWVTFLKLFLG